MSQVRPSHATGARDLASAPDARSAAVGEAWHAVDVEEVSSRLEVAHDGLSSAAAARRLAEHGPNELAEVPPPSALATFAGQFRSPLIFILLVAAVVTAALGEWIDTAVIAAVLLVNAAIGFVQERKAEQSVRALRKLVSPQARVIRDGHERQLPSRELVPGDVVLLESGVRVPADVRLVHVVGLQVDESLLTGESVPVTKGVHRLPAGLGLADRVNMGFAGSMVTTGRGRGIVVATGPTSQLGVIADRMREEVTPSSPLQRRMSSLARLIGTVVGIASAAAFVIGVAVGEPADDMFRFAVALAVSSIPEGLPIVLTITLALGVRRMARRNAVVRRLAAVETLGSTAVIGSDKTGTLTENCMTVTCLYTPGRLWSLDPVQAEATTAAAIDGHPLRRALSAGVLANEAAVYQEDGELRTEGDPTEAALLVAAWLLGVDPEQLRDEHDVLAEVPFESERRYSASVRHDGDEHRLICVKGAPERVAALCATQLGAGGIEPFDLAGLQEAERRMAENGLRVLAVAERRVAATLEPDLVELTAPDAIVEAGQLTFLGLHGMLDPPRPGVAEAIAGCRDAGIRTLMITGDHALTARTIAARIGVSPPDGPVLLGTELDELSDHQLAEAVRDTSVFARVSPEHKLRIVQAVRANGDIVAVTGDGVNDAPALKAADMGIAMGRGGTDVAREAADMVLSDDNFTSIYAAVHEGRVTFDNVRKATFFLLSTGAAAIAALLTALALRWPLLMLPTQLLWLNLVTNGVQDVAMAFEPAEADVLRRRPRPVGEGVMSRLLWRRTALVGLVMAAGTLAAFRWTLDDTGDVAVARTVALTTMVLFQAFHLGNARSERVSVFRLAPLSNPFLFAAMAIALGVHAAALYLPPTQYLLHVEPLDALEWALCIALASTVIVAVELHKALIRAFGARPGRRT